MRVVLLLVVSLLAVVACRTKPSPPVDQEGFSHEGQTVVLDGMSKRAGLLQQLHGYGVIELTWTDQDGDHFEQGDVEFWLDGQHRRAMRISKLGEPYFWVGTDGLKAWVFDLSSSPRQLLVDSLAAMEAAETADSGIASVSELMRILPLGIGTIPLSEAEVVSCRTGGDGNWLLELQPSERKIDRELFTINSDTWRPVRVSLLNANGSSAMILSTPSRRMVRVDIPNRSSLGSPLVSAILEIAIIGEASATAKFALEKLSTDMSEQPLDRLFELDILRQAMQPEVEGSLIRSGTGDQRDP